MKTISGGARFAVHAALWLIATQTHAEVTSSHPQISVIQPDGDLNPILPLMPLAARLDYRMQVANQTGAEINYLGGEVRFYDANGDLTLKSSLAPETLASRSAFSASAFVDGVSLIDIPDFRDDSLVDIWTALDGRTWVLGSARDASDTPTIVLGRFKPDGRPDESLVGEAQAAGIVRTPVKAVPRGMAVVPSVGIFVAGGTIGGPANPFVAKFTENGSRAMGFGGGDAMATWNPATLAFAEDIVVDGEGRPIVGGWGVTAGVQRPFVSRLSATGALDATFGPGGTASLNVPGATSARIQAVTVDGQDRVVFAGFASVNGANRMLIGRLGTDGTLDPKFGGDGITLLNFGGMASSAAAGVSMVGTRIAVVGRAANQDGNEFFAVARLLDDGSMDTDFGTVGRVTFGFPGTEDSAALGITVDLFGRMLVTGHASVGATRQFAIARVKSDGSLDPSFSKDGLRTLGGFGGGARSSAVGSGILYQGDVGDIIIGGSAEIAVDDPLKTDPSRWAMARLDFNGGLNPGVAVPKASGFRTDFLDFPFASDDDTPPFAGFDPKSAPHRMEVELRFKEIASPVVITGIEPKQFERNRNGFRFPLVNPANSPDTHLRINQSHHFGQAHVGNPGQRYALDLGMIDTTRNSSRLPDNQLNIAQLRTKWSTAPGFDANATYVPKDFNEAYLIYGAPVSAIAAGQVVFARDGDPENFPVGTRDTRSGGGGNSIIINHGNGELSFYAHMIPGTLTVKLGDIVSAGQLLGRVGNSGSSTGPHLHFHVMRSYPNPAATDLHGAAVPMYFNNLSFSSGAGRPQVRQLRAELPQGTVFDVFAQPFANTTPGTAIGPGKLGSIPAGNTLQGAPVLVPPVQVTGSMAQTDTGSVADAGDVAERIYAFSVPETGYANIRLGFAVGLDLDFVVYDRNLNARRPMAGKTRNRPENATYLLTPGTYFLLVSRDDLLRAAAATFTLDVTFTGLPAIRVDSIASPAGAPAKLRLRVPLALDPDGEPLALLLPAIQKIRSLSESARWEGAPIRPSIARGEATFDVDIPRDDSEFYRIAYPDLGE